jgi:predicted component of type VI protein secretion system
MTGGHIQNLVDLDPVQGFRIGTDNFRQLIDTDRADPFGHGSDLAGTHRGTVSRDGVTDEPRFVMELLRSLDGSLPDYLIEALHSDMNAEDSALHDFLGLFDRRLLQLWLETEQRATLVSQDDAQARGAGVIDSGISRLLGVKRDDCVSSARLLPALLALVLRSQNLETLRRILGWLIKRDVRIVPRFNHKHHLSPDCRLQISHKAGPGNALGGGIVLGRRALPASGRLEIEIICQDADDLAALRTRHTPLRALPALTRLFLRDPVPVSYFARVARRDLEQPRLSRDGARAIRLGPHGCLEPAAKPNGTIRLKLDFSTPISSGGNTVCCT